MSGRLVQIVFNTGVLVGLAAMTVGAAFAFGPAIGALVFGLVVWVTTIVSTAVAFALRREMGYPRAGEP